MSYMAYSKLINIFLPTESSDETIELEILNRNGNVIKIPRKDVDTYAEYWIDVKSKKLKDYNI